MPLIDLTYPAGTFDAETRTQLADELTTLLLHWEGAPDTEFFRSIAWVHIHELPGEHVYASGRPVETLHFKAIVTVPDGALSARRKAGLVEAFTAELRAKAGLGEDANIRIWVLINEVPEGNWGAAGAIVQFEQLRAAARAEREYDPSADPAPAGTPA
jgi:phenylpyruvate tautomerase PptA (4-oxalocrotonate tautomerase family)